VILTVDPADETPIYQQIRDRIVEAIASGDLASGSPLPPTRQLAVDLAINFHTVNKAYDHLRQEGLLRLGRGSGGVVARDARSGPASAAFADEWRARLRTLLAEAVAQGVPAADVIDVCREVLASFGTGDAAPEGGSR
jgi:DNA-binding transcriptional regulator YhcF (GntR family)